MTNTICVWNEARYSWILADGKGLLAWQITAESNIPACITSSAHRQIDWLRTSIGCDAKYRFEMSASLPKRRTLFPITGRRLAIQAGPVVKSAPGLHKAEVVHIEICYYNVVENDRLATRQRDGRIGATIQGSGLNLGEGVKTGPKPTQLNRVTKSGTGTEVSDRILTGAGVDAEHIIATSSGEGIDAVKAHDQVVTARTATLCISTHVKHCMNFLFSV